MIFTILVKIREVGTGDDATIGMKSGDLKWSSNDLYPTWYGGFIDNTTVDGVSSSINIVNGGGLGGLEGTLTITAINQALQAPLIDGTISIVGKYIEIYATDGVTTSIRYSGKITAWELQDEATIEITSNPVNALDLLKIPTTTIDSDMALGLSDSSANGKTIDKVYGNICDFPLIYVPSESVYTSAMLTPEYSPYIDGLATKLDASYQMLDGNGNFRAINTMQVLGKYQESETENVKICLSVNGRPMFTDDSETIASYVKKQLVGSSLKVIRGTGEGNVYNIIDADFETHTLGDVSTSTIWFTIDTSDISAITESSGYEATPDKTDTTSHHYFIALGSLDTAIDGRIIAPYSDGIVQESVSFVQLIGASNIYIVSKDADLASSVSLVGESNENEIVIPSDGVRILYESDNWRMIRIEITDSVSDSQSDYIVKNAEQVATRVLEPVSSPDPFNSISTGDYYLIVPNAEADGALIGTTVNYASFSDSYFASLVNFNNTQSIEIDSVIGDIDLSNPDLSISVVPNISYRVLPTLTSSDSDGIFITIDICATNNANLVVSKKRITRKYACPSEWDLLDPMNNVFSIDPINQTLVFPTSATKYINSGESSFASLLKDCDITDIIKSNSNGDIRYLIISTRVSINTYVGIFPCGCDCWTTFKPSSIFYSTKVAKDGLYLRATKTQTTDTEILSPSDIVRQLAIETDDIAVDAASFDAVQAYQTAMMTSIPAIGTTYKGQIISSGGDTMSELFDSVGKQSMTAFYTEPVATTSGTVALKARWFSEDETPTFTIDGTNIVKGSFNVSKPDGGMVFTDYNFKLTKSAFGTEDTLSVNTDASAIFPDSDYIETYGDILGTETGYTIDTVQKYDHINIVRILDATSDKIILSKFNVGTKWKLNGSQFGTPSLSVNATITNVSYEFSRYLESGKSCYVAFKYDTYPGSPSTFEVSSIQSLGSHYKWQDCVTGDAGANYTDAKNIWEYAKASRLHLGINRAMPTEYTTISDPIWGSDSRALRQFCLYTTKWNAREKTIVKFTMPMNSDTLVLKLLQYVSVSFGVFASSPISGYITDMSDDYSNATISVSLLCPKSAEALLTILNENYASADLIIDETTDATTNFNEGLLA